MKDRPLARSFELLTQSFGQKLTNLGFDREYSKKSGFYLLDFKDGLCGIHVAERYFATDACHFNVRCAVTLHCVQNILTKTELYGTGRGRTWSYGIDLAHLCFEDRKHFRNLRGHNLFNQMHFEFYANSTPDDIATLVEDVYADVAKYGWPFLERYGSLRGSLELTLRDDHISNLCFLDPHKALTGLILARELGLTHYGDEILRQASKRFLGFEQHGNSEPKERFCRLVLQLGLVEENNLQRYFPNS
jgi:hypothetical protein